MSPRKRKKKGRRLVESPQVELLPEVGPQVPTDTSEPAADVQETEPTAHSGEAGERHGQEEEDG